MTLMIRCHGSPPLFTLFRPIAAHRTVSILEKKKLSPALLLDHIPAWTLSLQILLSDDIDQQNFIEFFTTCLSIVGVSMKSGIQNFIFTLSEVAK